MHGGIAWRLFVVHTQINKTMEIDSFDTDFGYDDLTD